MLCPTNAAPLNSHKKGDLGAALSVQAGVSPRMRKLIEA